MKKYWPQIKGTKILIMEQQEQSKLRMNTHMKPSKTSFKEKPMPSKTNPRLSNIFKTIVMSPTTMSEPWPCPKTNQLKDRIQDPRMYRITYNYKYKNSVKYRYKYSQSAQVCCSSLVHRLVLYQHWFIDTSWYSLDPEVCFSLQNNTSNF